MKGKRLMLLGLLYALRLAVAEVAAVALLIVGFATELVATPVFELHALDLAVDEVAVQRFDE